MKTLSDSKNSRLTVETRRFPVCNDAWLDLNMGYYHIQLSPFSKHLCAIVMPFGKYEYQHLPMGLLGEYVVPNVLGTVSICNTVLLPPSIHLVLLIIEVINAFSQSTSCASLMVAWLCLHDRLITSKNNACDHGLLHFMTPLHYHKNKPLSMLAKSTPPLG